MTNKNEALSKHPKLSIHRHDLSEDRSLKAFSAADELILQNVSELVNQPKSIAIYHDRFGYLSCHLNQLKPIIIFTNKSQLKAIETNSEANQLTFNNYLDPLSPTPSKIDLALLKVPKSLELFELYLQHITQNSAKEVRIIIGFMTRHFSVKMIEIAEKYFGNVTQSRAVKKARTATLSKKKKPKQLEIINSLEYKGNAYQQYWGVFSAKHIDYATQYFLEHLEVKSDDQYILDLASGNGVIAKEISKKHPDAIIHLMDDSFLAVESAKLNISGDRIHHHFENNLSIFEDNTFDLIVTNPPFHFEYEINIQIPIQLFRECYRCLKPNGTLQIVANKHLNYSSQLKTIFSSAETVVQNSNFMIIKCKKWSIA